MKEACFASFGCGFVVSIDVPLNFFDYFSYYAGGAAGSWVAGLAYEGWSWGGSVISIILFQILAVTIAVTYLQPRPVPTS